MDTNETTTTAEADAVATRPGRPRDPRRDDAIIDAALEVLVSDGYDRLTIERVAAHAGVGKATIYRRWKSKAELVIDSMASLKTIAPIDTGTLDGDIAEMVGSACSAQSQRTMQVMVSICSALGREPELLTAFRERFTEPRIARISALLERARERGELSIEVDIAMAASLLPSLMLQQALMTGKPAGWDPLESTCRHASLSIL